MPRRPALSRSVLALAATALLVAGCSSGAAEPVGSEPAPSSSAALPSPSTEAPGGGIALGGEELPPGWPEGLPSYVGGQLLSAVVTEDGLNVNASWASDEPADEAWAAMDTALRDAGLVPVAETGAESMLIEDETQRSDLYTGNGLEANIIVVKGDQTTVLLNASVL